MGLFDYLICDHSLPDEEAQEAVFQTKSLDAALELYRIGEDGMLYRAERGAVLIDPDEEDYDQIAGIRAWEGPLPFHGDVVFYHLDEAKRWFEYTARFSEGHLLRLGRKSEAEAWAARPLVPNYSLEERGRMAHLALGFADAEEAERFLQRALAIYEQDRNRGRFLLALCNLIEGLDAPAFRQIVFRESVRAAVERGLDELGRGEGRVWDEADREAFDERMCKRLEGERRKDADS